MNFLNLNASDNLQNGSKLVLFGKKFNNKEFNLEFELKDFPVFKFNYEALSLTSNEISAFELHNEHWKTVNFDLPNVKFKITIEKYSNSVLFREFSLEELELFVQNYESLSGQIENINAYEYLGNQWVPFDFNSLTTKSEIYSNYEDLYISDLLDDNWISSGITA